MGGCLEKRRVALRPDAVGLGLWRWDRLVEPGHIFDKASIINITIQNPGCKAHVPSK